MDWALAIIVAIITCPYLTGPIRSLKNRGLIKTWLFDAKHFINPNQFIQNNSPHPAYFILESRANAGNRTHGFVARVFSGPPQERLWVNPRNSNTIIILVGMFQNRRVASTARSAAAASTTRTRSTPSTTSRMASWSSSGTTSQRPSTTSPSRSPSCSSS